MRLYKLDQISINFSLKLLLGFFYTFSATVEDKIQKFTSASLCGYVPRNYAMYIKKKTEKFR